MNNYINAAISSAISQAGMTESSLAVILMIILVWSLFWKGLALWHAGRKGQGWWFVILLLVNTAGILEIIYLFGVLRLKASLLFTKH